MNCPNCGRELEQVDTLDFDWDGCEITLREVWVSDPDDLENACSCRDGLCCIRSGDIDWDSEVEWI